MNYVDVEYIIYNMNYVDVEYIIYNMNYVDVVRTNKICDE